MISKGNQHAKTYMVFLLIAFSFYSTGSLRNADAFEIGIPDIPFLNFNFENIFKSDIGEESQEENAEGKVSDIIASYSRESKDEDLSSNVNANIEEYASDVESGLQTYDSLPFPSNAINNEQYGQSDKEEEDKEVMDKDILIELEYDQVFSLIPNALPLIGDYSDFPSTFLDASPATTEVGNEIPNQYIVVLEEDDSEVSDFIDTISKNTKFQGIELLQVYEEVLNGLAIKVPNERVIEAIEKLPMVDYVENDVMTQAFAQTLPSGVNRID
ncbi:MAG TPA: protease inhibitor I9 family protein [Candidatus Nitrosocosmicus sp.]|nr:protease inhibitor I9 family protein [Candidatus Nitrosocosmicus sp.]